jgi:hypothetical protein
MKDRKGISILESKTSQAINGEFSEILHKISERLFHVVQEFHNRILLRA